MPNNKNHCPISSPRLFVGCFPPKGLSDSEFSMSPTSPLSNPWRSLGLADVLVDDNNSTNKSFLLDSSQLVKINQAATPSPSSPIEFGGGGGVNKKISTSSSSSRSSSKDHDDQLVPLSLSPEVLSEMELSEEYTCVVSHGPNPKTTHIFDNCIVEMIRKENGVVAKDRYGCSESEQHGFLSFCCACNKNLSPGKDIFMYRGDKAFCSEDCRRSGMLFDDEMGEFEDLSDLC